MGYGTGGGGSALPAQLEIVGPLPQGAPISGPGDIPNPVTVGIVTGEALTAWDGVVVNAALGETPDAAATDSSGSWSVVALLKGLWARLPGLGQKTKAASMSVTLSSDQGALAVSDNSGSLTVDSAQLPTTLGQKTKANSMSVALASDQGALTVSGSVGVSQSAFALTSRGGDTVAGSKLIFGYNPNRSTIIFQNVSDTDMWLNLAATAAASQPSMRMPANMAAPFVLQNAGHFFEVSVYCAVASKGYAYWDDYYDSGGG